MNILKRELFHLKRNKELLLLAIPGIIFVLVFNYYPMFGLQIAFKNYTYDKGIWGSDWVGFRNFTFFFTSQDVFRITRNTILYNAGCIIIGTAAAVIFALILNELSRKSLKVLQTAFLMPYFLSWVVASFILYAFLGTDYGVMNQLVTSLGGDRIMWYNEPVFWPAIIMICYLWKNVGYLAIIYYTGLMGVDIAYYEAAEIDGATKLQQIRYISIPMLRPLVILMTLLAIGRIFYSDFGMFYFLPRNSGILFGATDVIDTYVYRALRKSGDVGMASAVGAYQSLVGFVLVFLSNKLSKRIDESGSIF